MTVYCFRLIYINLYQYVYIGLDRNVCAQHTPHIRMTVYCFRLVDINIYQYVYICMHILGIYIHTHILCIYMHYANMCIMQICIYNALYII